MKTIEVGNVVYDLTGHEAIVVGKTSTGFVVEPVIQIDSGEDWDTPPHEVRGDAVVWKKENTFLKPPKAKLEKEIAEKVELLESLKARIQDHNQTLTSQRFEKGELEKRYASHPQLKDLDLLVKGEVRYLVLTANPLNNYVSRTLPIIVPLENSADVNKAFSNLELHPILTLGVSVCEVSSPTTGAKKAEGKAPIWFLKSGSNSWESSYKRVAMASSYEQALEIANAYLDKYIWPSIKTTPIDNRVKEVISRAKKNGFTIPDRIIALCEEQERIEENSEVVRAKRAYLNAVHDLKKKGIDPSTVIEENPSPTSPTTPVKV